MKFVAVLAGLDGSEIFDVEIPGVTVCWLSKYYSISMPTEIKFYLLLELPDSH